MFTVFTELITNIISGAGALFIALGLSLSGSGLPIEESFVTEEGNIPELIQEAEISESKAVADTYQPSSKPAVKSPQTEPLVQTVDTTDSSSESDDTIFKIKDIQITSSKEGTLVNISWNTTKPARSRVEFNGTTYDSQVSLSTEHNVSISGLVPNIRYDYEIWARTQDSLQIEDDVRGVYVPIKDGRTHIVSLGKEHNECQEFIVTDRYGKVSSGIAVNISALINLDNGTNYSKRRETFTSNQLGVIDYCEINPSNTDIIYSVSSPHTGTLKLHK